MKNVQCHSARNYRIRIKENLGPDSDSLKSRIHVERSLFFPPSHQSWKIVPTTEKLFYLACFRLWVRMLVFAHCSLGRSLICKHAIPPSRGPGTESFLLALRKDGLLLCLNKWLASETPLFSVSVGTFITSLFWRLCLCIKTLPVYRHFQWSRHRRSSVLAGSWEVL